MKKSVLLVSFCCIVAFQSCAAARQPHAGTPSRVEKKSFAGMKEVKFDQAYGNITVKESDSEQIELEIQYYDGKKDKPVCDISTGGNVLSIKTIRPKIVKNEEIKIDYIIFTPRHIAMTVNLKYGNIKMGDFYSEFTAKLAYSNLNANSFINNRPSISCDYGTIKIEKAELLQLSTDYSNVEINAANLLDIKSAYTNYKIGNVQNSLKISSFVYGDIKINSVGSISAKLSYSGLSIETLEKSLDVKCDYSDVKIKQTSKQLAMIKLDGSYSDLNLGLHPDLSANFDINLTYGDLNISKRPLKYTAGIEKGNKIMKVGTLGNQPPTAQITVSSTYGDVKIK
jgi:hypothetical protein